MVMQALCRLLALALVLGLAFCIERIIYLSLSEIDAKRFVGKLEDMIVAGEIEQAKALSRDTRWTSSFHLLSRSVAYRRFYRK